MEKVKRKRIVKQAKRVILNKPDKPADIKPADVELIAVAQSSDVIASCGGCYYYDESQEKCNDDGNHDCTGVIFVKK